MYKASTFLRYAVVLIALVVLVVETNFAVRVMLSDIRFFQVQRTVFYWGELEAKPGIEEILATQNEMEAVLDLWPAHPDYLALLARIHIWDAVMASDSTLAVDNIRQAIGLMERSLSVRPANPYSWAELAEYHGTFTEKDPAFSIAVDKALKFGGGDIELIKRMEAISFR